MNLRQLDASLTLDEKELSRTLWDAEIRELMSIIKLWNMIAPGVTHRVDPRKPNAISKKVGRRLNILMGAIRDTRVQAAEYSAKQCLEMVHGASSIEEACGLLEEALAQSKPEEEESCPTSPTLK